MEKYLVYIHSYFYCNVLLLLQCKIKYDTNSKKDRTQIKIQIKTECNDMNPHFKNMLKDRIECVYCYCTDVE